MTERGLNGGQAEKLPVSGSVKEEPSIFKRTFISFKNPIYRFYYGGMLGQTAAQNMQGITNSLLIYRLTGSAGILGAMSFANAIPMLIFALFGGVLADRVQKKYVMLIGQVAFALTSVTVAITLNTGYLSPEHAGSWWVLVVTSAANGVVMGLIQPSRQAVIPEIVGGEQLMNAISLNTMGMNTCQIFAPGVAGLLVDALGFKAVYYTMTGMYLIAIVFFIFLPLTGTLKKRGISALEGIKEGLKYVRTDRNILFVLAFSLVVVFLAMPYGMMLPIFADDILKVGAKGMGILMSVSGLGALCGSIILASLPNKKRGIMFMISCLVLGLALVGFAFSKSWYLSLALIVFIGLGQTGRMTLSNTLLQYYVEDNYVGRVMSLYMMQFGLTSFSTFAAGMMTEVIGVQWSIGGFAIVLVLLTILGLAFVPRIRKLQ